MKVAAGILISLLLFSYAVQAQTINGRVSDAKTKETLPFVNVGVIGKSVGTVTNENGSFSLNVTNHNADSIRISMLGYKPQTFSVSALLQNTSALNIALVPDVINLKEVKVNNRKWKTAVLGNTTRSQTTTAGFTSNALGHEIGAIIKIKRSPTWLKRFNASLVDNQLDSVKMRLNVYSVKDGLPDQNLLQQNIFVTVKKGQQAIDVDLAPYNIVVDDKFFISLEWIQNASGHGLHFSASLFSSAFIARETSQAAWQKVGIVGVGFNVTAEY